MATFTEQALEIVSFIEALAEVAPKDENIKEVMFQKILSQVKQLRHDNDIYKCHHCHRLILDQSCICSECE